MAEFCLDCWNRMNGTNYDKRKYVISKDLDLCEGCASLKHVIVAERRDYYKYKLRYLILPFKIVYLFIYCFCRLFTLPRYIYGYRKHKKLNKKA